MDITLRLDPETERLIREEAARRGMTPEALAQAVVVETLEREQAQQRAKNAAARELLRTWSEDGDEQEQRETFEAIAEGLNAERKGVRQHYPALRKK
jgi:hypothetical protein